jgi:hypothetical protein
MRRILLLCFISLLSNGCERPKTQSDQNVSAAPPPESAAPVTPERATSERSAARMLLAGAPRRNKYLQLGIKQAGFDPAAPAAPAGLRYFTVELRGTGRAQGNDFVLEFQPYVFAQSDKGCIARPEIEATWLERPFGPTAVFKATEPTEGQLAFLVPDDSEQVRILIASADDQAGMSLPAGEDFAPTWPEPIHVIEDGSTLRVLVLPSPGRLATLPPPATGRQHIVLDLVIENLRTNAGIEFTTSQQLRLIDPVGNFIQLSNLTRQLGCRLDDGDVVPPGHARRLMAVYDAPDGMPRRLQYRGFEVDEVTVDLDQT